jgi:hypothetical protein
MESAFGKPQMRKAGIVGSTVPKHIPKSARKHTGVALSAAPYAALPPRRPESRERGAFRIDESSAGHHENSWRLAVARSGAGQQPLA